MGGRMGGVTDQGTRERVSCRSILHGLIGMGRCNISRAHWAWSWGVRLSLSETMTIRKYGDLPPLPPSAT